MKELACAGLASLPLVTSAAATSPDEAFCKDAAAGGLPDGRQVT